MTDEKNYLSHNGKAVHKQHKFKSNTFNFRQLVEIIIFYLIVSNL